jgi:hypothetical protein
VPAPKADTFAGMNEYERMGIAVQTSRLTETIEIMGKKTTTDFLLTTLTFPTPPKVQASFSKEGLVNKLVKLFKKELQVGDKTFDDIVYISTDTPAETAAFLQSPEIQNTLMLACSAGGSVTIEGQRLVAKYPYAGTNEDADVLSLVGALLAL